LWEAGLRFVLTAAGGIAVGLAVGMIVAEVRRRLDNPPIEITISLMTGYFAYLPAEAIGVSGVLAAVTVGIYVGRLAPELTTVQQRLQGIAAWEILVFVANSLLFVLVGLQLPAILDNLSGRSIGTLALATVLVCVTVILTRVFWVFPFMHLPHFLSRRDQDSRPPWQKAALVSWMGMRGAVALAAALALPLETDAGALFPERDLIVFITFCVILVTLVVQGLTLPALIRVLELPADGREEKEEIKARIFAADAALARLDALVDEDWVREETAERLRGLYGFRRGRFAARFDDSDEGAIERQSLDFQRLRRELLDAERAAVVGMRNEGRINDEVMRRIERDLDLEDARLEI
jgi:monovalent cation/hydrogen antiporter